MCLGKQQDGRSLLGLYDIQTRVAHIDFALRADAGDPRRVFTLYHEVAGHGVLQGEWLRSQLGGPCVLEESDATIDFRNRQVLEWQANAMAGFTAAPKWLLERQIVKRLELRRPIEFVEPKRYYIGSRTTARPFFVESYLDLCRAVATMVQPWFGGLSVEALSYRVRSCNRLVIDRSGEGMTIRNPGMRIKRVKGSPWMLGRAVA